MNIKLFENTRSVFVAPPVYRVHGGHIVEVERCAAPKWSFCPLRLGTPLLGQVPVGSSTEGFTELVAIFWEWVVGLE